MNMLSQSQSQSQSSQAPLPPDNSKNNLLITREENDEILQGKIAWLEMICTQVKEQFHRLLTITTTTLDTNSLPSSIPTNITNATTNAPNTTTTNNPPINHYFQTMHDTVEQFLRALQTFQQLLVSLLDLIKKKKDNNKVQHLSVLIEEFLEKTFLPTIQTLPIIFDITVHDFSVIYCHLITLTPLLERIQSKHKEVIHQYTIQWQEHCLDEMFRRLDMVFLFHTLHSEWSSHSMFQRNKKFSPGLIAFTASMRSLFFHLAEHTKRQEQELGRQLNQQQQQLGEDSMEVKAKILPLLIEISNRWIREVIRVYLQEILASRVRLWQVKADLIYVLLALLTQFDYLRRWAGPSLSLQRMNTLSMERAWQCWFDLIYLLWQLHLLYSTDVDMVLNHVNKMLEGWQRRELIIPKEGSWTLSSFIDSVYHIIEHCTALPSHVVGILLFESSTASYDSMDHYHNDHNDEEHSRADHFHYPADVICLLGLRKERNSSDYHAIQAQLIEIVKDCAFLNPLVDGSLVVPSIDDPKTAMMTITTNDLIEHGFRLSSPSIVSSVERRSVAIVFGLVDVKKNIKTTLYKRYDVMDCEYPALTEDQKIAYDRFHAFIKEHLLLSSQNSKVIPSTST